LIETFRGAQLVISMNVTRFGKYSIFMPVENFIWLTDLTCFIFILPGFWMRVHFPSVSYGWKNILFFAIQCQKLTFG